MIKLSARLTAFVTISLGSFMLGHADEPTVEFQPQIVPKVIDKARNNNNWKLASVTGKDEQVVFMNISPMTNPKNEIGEEVHPFDQVILIVEGKGKAILNGKKTAVEEGDMIFIPQGISHNLINSNKNKGLRLISFYSATDIPNGAFYPTKADEGVEE